MPSSKPNDSVKKNLFLITLGIGLQTTGTICLIASAVGISRKISQQMRKTRV